VRFRDRFYDLYVEEPMQKIVHRHRPHGVEVAKAQLELEMVNETLATKTGQMLSELYAKGTSRRPPARPPTRRPRSPHCRRGSGEMHNRMLVGVAAGIPATD
jgi:hypothetical protein